MVRHTLLVVRYIWMGFNMENNRLRHAANARCDPCCAQHHFAPSIDASQTHRFNNGKISANILAKRFKQIRNGTPFHKIATRSARGKIQRLNHKIWNYSQPLNWLRYLITD